MVLALLIIFVVTAGGFAATYLAFDDRPLMWRLAAGCVAGSAIAGTVTFVLALALGLNAFTSVVGTLSPLVFLIVMARPDVQREFREDRQRAKGKFQGTNFKKLLPFVYWTSLFGLLGLFFDRYLTETAAGIFTGGSQNLGDLPFHLGVISSFTDGANFPPENPSFAGARFSYPFIADLLTAGSIKLSGGLRDVIFVQDAAWGFSLAVLVERFARDLSGNKLAGRLAPWLLFLSGGLGFLTFFGDVTTQGRGFLDLLWHLPTDYTIGQDYRWGNSLVVLFMTQRSLLLGMPLTMVVIEFLRLTFFESAASVHWLWRAIIAGSLAGTLPLIHLHSLGVLFVIAAVILLLRPAKWKDLLVFGVATACVSVPELLWAMNGSASHATDFLGWNFGWSNGDTNLLIFWVKNTGPLFLLLAGGLYLIWKLPPTSVKGGPSEHPQKVRRLEFYIPFAILFCVANAAKLAPWEWDNIKVLIYWFVGSLPFVGFALAYLWQRKATGYRVLAAALFAVAVFAGSLDVWHTISGAVVIRVFGPDAVDIGEQIKLRTAADAVFLNAPTYNTAVALSGRRSVMRYPGHLSSHGIDYGERETDLKRIYAGAPESAELLAKYNVKYVLVSPEERALMTVNDAYFASFPTVAEAGPYKVYDVRKQ